MAWRLARSLTTLRDQINRMAPSRSKVSDGTIGDPAHADRCSRHNPNNAEVVCALDITDDPAHGCPIHVIAENIRKRPHPELEYIISNGRIASRSSGWVWRTYTGTNPHSKHVHFAVGRGLDCEPTSPYDSTQSWNLGTGEDDVSKADVIAALNEQAVKVGEKSFAGYMTNVLETAAAARSTALVAVAEVRALQESTAAQRVQAPSVEVDYEKLAKALVAEMRAT